MADYDPNKLRSALEDFVSRRKAEDPKFNPTNWSARADVPEGAVRNFLKGRSRTLEVATLTKLAAAESISLAELVGDAGDRDSGARSTGEGGAPFNAKIMIQVIAKAIENLFSDIETVTEVYPKKVAKEIIKQYEDLTKPTAAVIHLVPRTSSSAESPSKAAPSSREP